MKNLPFKDLKDLFNNLDLGQEVSFWAFKSVMQAVVLNDTLSLSTAQIGGLHRIEHLLPEIKADLGLLMAA